MQIDQPETFRAALQDGINLFVGAGFSVLASDVAGKSLPTAPQFAAELRQYFGCEDLDQLDLAQLCTVIESTRADDLQTLIEQRFRVDRFDQRYGQVRRLAIRALFSTNVDNLLHRIYENSVGFYLNDLDFIGAVNNDAHAIPLLMLHGSVLHRNRRRRFGSLDVASSFSADPGRWRNLESQLQHRPTLFWGYSLRDPATLEALTAYIRKGSRDAWTLVRPPDATPGHLQYLRALGLNVILGDTADLLDYVAGQFPEDARAERAQLQADTKGRFGRDAIPAPHEVPARPIVEFFRGAPPVWSDIFSGQLHKTAHFDVVREGLNSKRHVIIAGIPASGKTTLLLQVASAFNFNGHKLVVEGLNSERAGLLLRLLNGEPALIFVDDFTTDVDPFLQLSRAANVRLVGADRDFYVNTVSHVLDRTQFRFVDVTPLSDKDLQACRQTIPAALRQESLVQPEVTEGIRPSLFEFMEANTLGPTLRERLVEALREHRRFAPQLAEMLVMVAYVHSCRTPVSTDMALSYWSDGGLGYQEVSKLWEDAGSVICEYNGSLADSVQDHFAVRSVLAAEAILEAADQGLLETVLTRFHANVSPVVVCQYRTFKRRAYDSRLIGRAFRAQADAEAFYERVYARDESPYILQQHALYLSHRGDFHGAFRQIDAALAKATKQNWTIRNSHAQILFRANISFSQRDGARATLDQAMNILRQCYTSDRRKAFHAMVFADYAMRYAEAYHDEAAATLLRQAADWLAEQRAAEPWLDGIERLQTQLRRALSNSALQLTWPSLRSGPRS